MDKKLSREDKLFLCAIKNMTIEQKKKVEEEMVNILRKMGENKY